MTTPDGFREQTRQQMLDAFGGWSGTVVTAIPPVVFVVANALGGLRDAVIAAVLSGVLLAVYRIIRRQPVQQALMGLLSVAVAAAIAARTGQARGYFLVGIAGSFVYAGVIAVTLAVRRPLVGLLWEFLDPTPIPEDRRWHQVRVLRRAYDLATLAAFAMFGARAAVQLSLFRQNRTGWLAVARIAMGYPLYVLVLGFAWWIVRRARQSLPAPEDVSTVSEPPPSAVRESTERSGGADGLSDSRFGLGQGDEE